MEKVNQLIRLVHLLDNDAEKTLVYSALGYTPHVDGKRHVLDWATSGAVLAQDITQPLASVAHSGKTGRDAVWAYVQTHFARLVALIGAKNSHILSNLISLSCSGFTTMEKAKEVTVFFQQQVSGSICII